MKTKFCLAVISVLSNAPPCLSAEVLSHIIVTASRSAQTEDETLASVTVITHEDIQRMQAQSLQDALRGVVGLTIANNGGAGKTTSMFLRGSESDHVLVLIDGIKIGSATSGSAPFQDIPVSQIERIEIVRGPRSSLYGSEAIGGVIQIFTKRGSATPKAEVAVNIGSNNTRGGNLAISGGGEDSWYSLGLNSNRTDSINACRGKPGPDPAGCFTYEPDKDGYRNQSVTLRGGYSFSNQLEIDAHAMRTESENDFDGGFVNESESRQQVLGGNLSYAPSDAWKLVLMGGRSWDKSDNFKEGKFLSRYDTERDSLSLLSDFNLLLDHQLSLGFDYQEERVESTKNYLLSERDNRGYLVKYQGQLSDQDLQLSLRQDDHRSFGKHNTGNIAWGYTWQSGLRTTASYGSAFKAPTFNELYYPDFGNPDLKPEESKSLELGLSGASVAGDWSINLFRTEINELIGFDASNKPANIDQALINGLEAQLTSNFWGWRWNTALTLLDPRNRSKGENRDNLLPRRTRQTLHVDLDRSFGVYSLGMSLHAEGRRFDDLNNQVELGGFGTLDLRSTYQIDKAWQLQGRLENLFDKSYETAAYFNQLGRSFYLTLAYQS